MITTVFERLCYKTYNVAPPISTNPLLDALRFHPRISGDIGRATDSNPNLKHIDDVYRNLMSKYRQRIQLLEDRIKEISQMFVDRDGSSLLFRKTEQRLSEYDYLSIIPSCTDKLIVDYTHEHTTLKAHMEMFEFLNVRIPIPEPDKGWLPQWSSGKSSSQTIHPQASEEWIKQLWARILPVDGREYSYGPDLHF